MERNWLRCPVTINGKWPGQPTHCKSFENPCLSLVQYNTGQDVTTNKQIKSPFTLIFVGRVSKEKGIDLLIDSIQNLRKEFIAKIHIVGDGPLLTPLQNKLDKFNINSEFHGFIAQEKIYRLLIDSDFIILPSRSEGFPKVIAEALNFGCIPVVTEVGSIPHYIKDNVNGFTLTNVNSSTVSSKLNDIFLCEEIVYRDIIQKGREMVYNFTFENYYKELNKQIIDVI